MKDILGQTMSCSAILTCSWSSHSWASYSPLHTYDWLYKHSSQASTCNHDCTQNCPEFRGIRNDLPLKIVYRAGWRNIHICTAVLLTSCIICSLSKYNTFYRQKHWMLNVVTLNLTPYPWWADTDTCWRSRNCNLSNLHPFPHCPSSQRLAPFWPLNCREHFLVFRLKSTLHVLPPKVNSFRLVEKEINNL